jgi:DNA-binding FadR family transcriptional regulator
MAAYRQVLRAILDATHNRLVQQLAQPLLELLNLRTWADLRSDTPDTIVASEARTIQHLIEAIASRDPDRAQADIAQLMKLPPEAIQAMKETPVGQIVQIPLPPHREPS